MEASARSVGPSVEPPPVQLPLEVATFRGRVDEQLSAQVLELEQQALVSAQEAVGEAKTWRSVDCQALCWLSS